MSDSTNKLRAVLKAVSRREQSVRFVVLSGRAYLVAALALFIVVIVRRFLVLRYDFEPLPYGGLFLVLAAIAGYVLVPVGVRVWIYLRRPAEPAIARSLDQRLRTSDLLASGLTAGQLSGSIPEAVVRRAAEIASGVSPEKLFPVRKSLLKTLAVIPLLLAAAYMLGLPTGDGMILMAGPGSPDLLPDSPEDPRPEVKPAPTPDARPDPEPEAEPDPEPEPDRPIPPKFAVRVVPSKKFYEKDEPIVLFVLADALSPLTEEAAFAGSVVLDGKPISLGQDLVVKPGPDGGAMVAIDARRLPEAREHLTGGKHKVSGLLSGSKQSFGGPEEEFEIEGESGGDQHSPQPEPQPQPPPPEPEPEPPPEEQPEPPPPPPPEPEPEAPPEDEGGEDQPPPDLDSVPRFVNPLFREGETVKKKGWALVPDPDAPAGSAPRRLPLDEAAREASKRPESAVPLERLKAADAATVSRYFELLRTSK